MFCWKTFGAWTCVQVFIKYFSCILYKKRELSIYKLTNLKRSFWNVKKTQLAYTGVRTLVCACMKSRPLWEESGINKADLKGLEGPAENRGPQDNFWSTHVHMRTHTCACHVSYNLFQVHCHKLFGRIIISVQSIKANAVDGYESRGGRGQHGGHHGKIVGDYCGEEEWQSMWLEMVQDYHRRNKSC